MNPWHDKNSRINLVQHWCNIIWMILWWHDEIMEVVTPRYAGFWAVTVEHARAGSGPAGIVLNIRASVSWTHSWPTVYQPLITQRRALLIGWRSAHLGRWLAGGESTSSATQLGFWNMWMNRRSRNSDSIDHNETPVSSVRVIMQHQHDIHI